MPDSTALSGQILVPQCLQFVSRKPGDELNQSAIYIVFQHGTGNALGLLLDALL